MGDLWRMPSPEPRYAIRIAARRSGLTAATVRAWERRYGAVQPVRSDTERRLYSDADIERLLRLRELTDRGHAIGRIAQLTTDALGELLEAERTLEARDAAQVRGETGAADARTGGSALRTGITLDDCERALVDLDGIALHRLLMRGMVELGPERFIERLVAPLCHSIGKQWEEGSLTVAHEHVASVALRNALGFLLETLQGAAGGPRLVATTPSEERHEFGAMMAAIVAAAAGWEVTYVGPDLPAADLGAAVRRRGARAVLLSIVAHHERAHLDAELRAARALVGPEVAIIVGGASAVAHAQTLADIGATLTEEFAVMRSVLERVAGRGAARALVR
jgi:MerR family transcriptional regulator, light-induced transcriptional regulator